MRQIRGHYGGSTWAGATRPFRTAASANAALVAPAHVLPEAKASTEVGPARVPDSVQSKYLRRSEVGTQSDPYQVPLLNRKRAAIAAGKETTDEQTEDRAWGEQGQPCAAQDEYRGRHFVRHRLDVTVVEQRPQVHRQRAVAIRSCPE